MPKLRRLLAIAASALAAFALVTWLSLVPVTQLFRDADNARDALQAFDRNGIPLSYHYHTEWNQSDRLPLYAIPSVLKRAMVQSEDKRFFTHRGVDWKARAGAVYAALTGRGAARGASTITEQIVRMLHPRPRNVWSKWLEGFEAATLDAAYSKEQLLEFYLNQVPYASGRRGVAQAARLYFGRDIDTLSPKEMLALVVLVRAPSSYDLRRHTGRIDNAILRLAEQVLPASAHASVATQPLALSLPDATPDASHFLRYVRQQPNGISTSITTTLDATLQSQLQQILDARVQQLDTKKVSHAAAIIIDNRTHEILSWVVAGEPTDINIITTPRQPGSAMKPFLYASALMQGYTAATVLDDSPMREAVGTGLHTFRNYSARYHGPVSLREALGNSLNIPALRTIRFVTPARYLRSLHALGFASLTASADSYDEGLALGAGEVTMLELATAYSTLANGGQMHPSRVFLHDNMQHATPRRIYSPEVSAIIGNILSDPWARVREFGQASVLSLPVQTAVKTGTSTDYRDAWAAGYNANHTVVVWMGNLDRTPMDGVTGSTGPALALRSIFAELTRDGDTRALPMPRSLEMHKVCVKALDTPPCNSRDEYFVRGTFTEIAPATASAETLELVQPTENLRLAYDPRIPPEHQSFRFLLRGVPEAARVRWVLNGELLAEDEAAFYDWPVKRGKYKLLVTIRSADGGEQRLAPVNYVVK